MMAYTRIIFYTKILPLDNKAALVAAGTSIRYDLPMADVFFRDCLEMHKATTITIYENFGGLDGIQFIT